MGALDAVFGNLAATLVDRVQLGSRPGTLRRSGEGKKPVPSTGLIAGGDPDLDYPCRFVLSEFRDDQIDGTRIQAGDRKALIARSTIGVTPLSGKDVLIEGSDPDAPTAVHWKIIGVVGHSSGEQEAAYSLHVRR